MSYIIRLIRKVLSKSKIRQGVRAARRGYRSFKRWYDALPWYVRRVLAPIPLFEIYKAFRDHL